MLIKDEAVQERLERKAAHEAYADRVNSATYDELNRARLMEDDDLAPNNPFRQMGRIMTPRDLDRLIAHFNIPNLLTEVHPTNPNKRCIYQVRGADKFLVCVHENNPMPEFSIVMGVEKWIPDPDYLGDGGRTVSRLDLPSDAPAPLTMDKAEDILKARGVSGLRAELGRRLADAEPTRIGMKRVLVPGPEKVRGWRTVLVYLMNHGLISAEQLRGAVRDADRASWAGLTGAQPDALGDWLK